MASGYQVDGQLMREARIKKGIGFKEMASLMQVAHTSVYRWEAGHFNPTLRNLRIFSNLVNKTPEYFMVKGDTNGGSSHRG